jgi:hypothetical protein
MAASQLNVAASNDVPVLPETQSFCATNSCYSESNAYTPLYYYALACSNSQ